jgi:hypothetical protein
MHGGGDPAKAVRLADSQFFLASWIGAIAVDALAGERRRARLSLKALEAKSKTGITSRYWPALAHASLGQNDIALGLLAGAFECEVLGWSHWETNRWPTSSDLSAVSGSESQTWTSVFGG